MEQLDKLPGGRTNPYVISGLIPLPSGEGMMADRVVVRYGSGLHRERSVVVAGTAYCEFLDSLEDVHRLWIQYGILLLKKLGDFKVRFVTDCKDTIY